MNYQAFTNDSLTMMYEAIRGALAADDALKRQGLAIRFRVRETPDWKIHAADLESEMLKRGMRFEVIDWSDDQPPHWSQRERANVRRADSSGSVLLWHSYWLKNAWLGAQISAMREHWTEDLVCPNCQKTGRAELSQTDDQSGDIEAELVPAGFKVIQLEHSITFRCASCDIAVKP
jgi:hypothetical protein